MRVRLSVCVTYGCDRSPGNLPSAPRSTMTIAMSLPWLMDSGFFSQSSSTIHPMILYCPRSAVLFSCSRVPSKAMLNTPP